MTVHRFLSRIIHRRPFAPHPIPLHNDKSVSATQRLVVRIFYSADADVVNICASDYLSPDVVIMIQPLWLVQLGNAFESVRLKTLGNLGAHMAFKPNEAFLVLHFLKIELLRFSEHARKLFRDSLGSVADNFWVCGIRKEHRIRNENIALPVINISPGRRQDYFYFVLLSGDRLVFARVYYLDLHQAYSGNDKRHQERNLHGEQPSRMVNRVNCRRCCRSSRPLFCAESGHTYLFVNSSILSWSTSNHTGGSFGLVRPTSSFAIRLIRSRLDFRAISAFNTSVLLTIELYRLLRSFTSFINWFTAITFPV